MPALRLAVGTQTSYSLNQNQRLNFSGHFANFLGDHSVFTQSGQKPHRVPGMDGEEQPAGGLWVVKQIANFLRNGAGELHALADEFDVSFQSARQKGLARTIESVLQKIYFAVGYQHTYFARRRHAARVPEQAEAGDVRRRVNFKFQSCL